MKNIFINTSISVIGFIGAVAICATLGLDKFYAGCIGASIYWRLFNYLQK